MPRPAAWMRSARDAQPDHQLAHALGARERELVVEGEVAHGVGVADHHDVGRRAALQLGEDLVQLRARGGRELVLALEEVEREGRRPAGKRVERAAEGRGDLVRRQAWRRAALPSAATRRARVGLVEHLLGRRRIGRRPRRRGRSGPGMTTTSSGAHRRARGAPRNPRPRAARTTAARRIECRASAAGGRRRGRLVDLHHELGAAHAHDGGGRADLHRLGRLLDHLAGDRRELALAQRRLRTRPRAWSSRSGTCRSRRRCWGRPRRGCCR